MVKKAGIAEWAALPLDKRQGTLKVRYNYRLRPSKTSKALLLEVFDSCRFVWNKALGRWSELWQEEHTSYSYHDASADLTVWRGSYDWLREQPSVTEQQVLRDLFHSVSAFYDKTNPAGRPQFKKKGRYSSARWAKTGFSITGTGKGSKGDRLAVATRTGRHEIPVVWSRPLPSNPSSVTVYRDSTGHYYASFVVEIPVAESTATLTGRTSGLDVGLTTLATAVDPEMDIQNPRHLRKAGADLKRKQRSVSRKARGSRNRSKARVSLAKSYKKLANARTDYHHKQARRELAVYDAIGYEDLRIKNLMRAPKPKADPNHQGRYLRNGRKAKAGLNRSISDAAWASFLAILCFQAVKLSRSAIPYNPSGTTQNCSECGTKAKDALGLKDRVFSCWNCGYEAPRDRNSARNLDPNRQDRTGAGCEGSKTKHPYGSEAA